MRILAALAIGLGVLSASLGVPVSSVAARSAANGEFPYIWTQYGPDGARIVRAVLDQGEACPWIRMDGKSLKMAPRTAATPSAFPVTVCSATLDDPAAAATVLGQDLPPLPDRVDDIVVVGDTGCRMTTYGWFQDCNDPDNPDPAKGWPLVRVVDLMQAAPKQLYVHVGDYHYREGPCPAGNQGCAGAISGDNWDSWRQDWFAPLRPILNQAPWVLVRGNHENCARAGEGWFLFMGHGPADQATEACDDYTDAFVTPIGADLEFVIMDSAQRRAPVGDRTACEAWMHDAAAALDSAPAPGRTRWAVTHQPIYSYFSTAPNNAATNSDPCAREKFYPAAWSRGYAVERVSGGEPLSYDLVLSGDVHLWQWTKPKDPAFPTQITAGNGATALEELSYWKLDAWPVGTHTDNPPYSDGGWWNLEVVFGYVTMTRMGSDAGTWRVDMIDVNDRTQQVCLHGTDPDAATAIVKDAALPAGSAQALLTGGCVDTGQGS